MRGCPPAPGPTTWASSADSTSKFSDRTYSAFSVVAASRIIRLSYELLGLISFLTVGPDECRAWTIPIGATAPEAAGAIHSDIQKGFIRAEVTY